MQIIDLRDLPQSIALVNTYTGNGLGTIHTLSIDAQNGYLYLNGSNLANGGLIILDVHTDPIHPVEVGRWSTRYVHDSQIVTYPPNHPTYANRQIAVPVHRRASIDIVDVTNKAALVLLSHTTYTGLAYSHQGWLTPNFQYIYQDDELDEQNNLVPNMTTRIFDVSNLSSPQLAGTYVAANKTIDHNLYIRDHFLYESDYRNGLQILNISGPPRRCSPATHLSRQQLRLSTATGAIPFLPSGHIILADIERGLFVLRFNELPGSTTFTIAAAPQALNVCAGGSAQSTISIGQIREFLPTVNLSASNLQPEITANFWRLILLPGSSTAA
ncbi:MAG: choice-of-anchor B family protein [Anaerolineae bacterium]|nr:choice-of-anchor B family protein [Anaerolineae bacterium]